MSSIRAGVSLLALVLAMPPPTCAQEAVPAGTRVRLTLLPSPGDDRPRTLTGRLTDAGASTLMLLDSRGRPQPFDRADIARLERSQGRRSRWRLAGIGFAAGAAVGAVTGSMAGGGCHRPGVGPCFSPATAGAFLALSFGGMAAGVGAILPPGERWVAVPLSPKAAGP